MARLTYINLLNSYYLLEIPTHIKARANALFLWLLHKANSLGFPKMLSIPNSLAQSKSGDMTPSTFRRAREVLTAYQLDGKPLITYHKSGSTHKAGKYEIHYNILLDKLPSWRHNGAKVPVKEQKELTNGSAGVIMEPNWQQTGILYR